MSTYALSPAQVEARHARGYGRGTGCTYRPWLGTKNATPTNVITRMWGWKTGRMHVSFNSLDRAAQLAARWCDDVTDMREHYPLLPLSETQAIADAIGASHPSRDGHAMVLTTSLLLTLDGERRPRPEMAVAVVAEEALHRPSKLERLEIERLYWTARGVPWRIVTGRELPDSFIATLDWISERYEITPETLGAADIARAAQLLGARLEASPTHPLRQVCFGADDTLGFPLGTGLTVVRHLLARKTWRIDMRGRVDPARPLPSLDTRAAQRSWRFAS